MTAPDATAALDAAAQGWPPTLRTTVTAHAQAAMRMDGARLFSPGDHAQGVLIPSSGAARVEHLDSADRSVVLLGADEICVMTTSHLLGFRIFGER